jgi:hypothetical protein
MLVGVATRRYARSLEPVPATMRSRGTSKSAVSRRFVTKTAAQLAAWQTAALERLDVVGLLIDGVHIGEHCLIVALGIAADGQKPVTVGAGVVVKLGQRQDVSKHSPHLCSAAADVDQQTLGDLTPGICPEPRDEPLRPEECRPLVTLIGKPRSSAFVPGR